MPSDSIPVVTILLTLLPILVAAILNAGEVAIVYLNDERIRHQIAVGDKKARRVSALCNQHKTLETTMLIFNLFAFFVSSIQVDKFVYSLSTDHIASAQVISGIGTCIYGLLYAAFIYSAPKKLAAYHPEGIAFNTLWLLELFHGFFKPLVWFIDCMGSLVIILSGNNPAQEPSNVTEEEIRMLVDEGEEKGIIEAQEKHMINNVLGFDDRTVDEVMTHRTQVRGLELSSSLTEVVRLAVETGYSRIPIYEEDIDSVVGIIYVKDLLRFLDAPEEFFLREQMRESLFVPASTTCAQMMGIFKEKRTQVAIVIDEYGGTYGVVTMEDLLEAIVGNILDEYDNEAELCTKVEEGVYLLSGALPINDVEHIFDIQIPEDSDSDTLSGFMIERLGGIPEADDLVQAVHFGGVTFTVLETSTKRIMRVRAVIKSLNP